MKFETAIKKVEKRLSGVTILHKPCSHDRRGLRDNFSFQYNGKVGSFYSCSDGSAAGFHVRREDDHTDTMTDYFAGSFYDNCTQMLNVIDPPAPKFAEGSLIRGKENKRADRLGIAGRMGIVTKVNLYGCYTLLMSDTGQVERYSYERDLELIS